MTNIFQNSSRSDKISTVNKQCRHAKATNGGIFNVNESVIKVLKNSMWDLATCANGEPNVVPVAFKDVTEDGKLVVGDVFLETTLNNIKANDGKIAISVYDAQSLEGYQIKGTAEYVTEGDVVDTFKAMVESMFKGAATAKGALIITPAKVIVTTPGADNKKEI